MKKFYSFLFAAVALVGFAACNSDSTEEVAPKQEVGKMEFTANIADDTKTQLNGTKVTWCAKDTIAVSNGTTVEKYTVKELLNDGKSAIFQGPELEGDVFYAAYPCPEELTEVSCTVVEGQPVVWAGIAIPTKQVAVAGSFADGAALAYGEYQGDYTFSFTNENAVLKFQVPADCSFVQFYNGSELAVELNGGLTAGNDYYAVVAPGTYTFTVRIDGYLSKQGTKALKLAKNNIYNLKTLPAPVQDDTWLVRGDHNNWGNTDKMYVDVNYLNKDGYKLLVLRNQPIKTTGFKFASSDWGLQVGAHDDNNSSDADVVVTPMTWWYGSNVNYDNKKAHICVNTEEYNYDVYLLVDKSNTQYTQAWFHLCETGTPMSSLPQSLN